MESVRNQWIIFTLFLVGLLILGFKAVHLREFNFFLEAFIAISFSSIWGLFYLLRKNKR